MLILKAVALEPLQGYGVGLKNRADQQGSIPDKCRLALPGLPPIGASSADQRASGARPRITGILTEENRKKLKTEAREWQTQSVAIARILEATSGEL